MDTAQSVEPETIYRELCIGVHDDASKARKTLKVVLSHGTFLADAIFISLAAKPFALLETNKVMRRLAFMRLPT